MCVCVGGGGGGELYTQYPANEVVISPMLSVRFNSNQYPCVRKRERSVCVCVCVCVCVGGGGVGRTTHTMDN